MASWTCICNITEGLVVYPKVIEEPSDERAAVHGDGKHHDGLREDAAATARSCTKAIRVHSMAAGRVVKEEGKPNDLLQRIADDPRFPMNLEQLQAIMKPANFVGRSVQQTEEFFAEHIDPILEKEKDALGMHADINV